MDTVKTEFWKAARDGRTPLILRFFEKKINQTVVDEIVNSHHTCENGESTTPLIIAAIEGNDEIVSVLAQNGAKLDLKGNFHLHDGSHVNGATALHCATFMGHYNILQELIDYGANVNVSTDNYGSSPLRIACGNGDLNLVQYLLEHGADVNSANIFEHTCLMLACSNGYYDIAEYLLRNGADPESVSANGTTALHESAKNGSLEIIELLRHVDIDFKMTKDNNGMTPLRMAIVNGHYSTAHYLSSLPQCTREDRIDACELRGASYIFGSYPRLSEAYHLFERAMKRRFAYSNDIFKKRVVAMTSIITGTAECQTLDELKEIEDDEIALHIEALAILERIFGSDNPGIHQPILLTGTLFAENGLYDKCLDLWFFALQSHRCSDKKFEFDRFLELFAEMFLRGIHIDFSRLLEVFKEAESELILYKERTHPFKQNDTLSDNYEKDILVCLYLIGFMLLTELTTKKLRQMCCEIYKFLQQNPRLQSGATPLHMSCDSKTNDNAINVRNIILFPNTLICKTLLHCGADVNAQDNNKETPLHVIAKTGNSIVQVRKISQCLIESGAHVDAYNVNGERVVDVASMHSVENMNIIKAHMQLRLECLAARVVMRHRHKLEYQNVIPASLVEFVELH